MANPPYDVHDALMNAAERMIRRSRARGVYRKPVQSGTYQQEMEQAFTVVRNMLDAGYQPSIPVDSPQTGYVFIQLEGCTEAGALYGRLKPGQDAYMSAQLRRIMMKAASIPGIVPLFYIYPNGTFAIRLGHQTA